VAERPAGEGENRGGREERGKKELTCGAGLAARQGGELAAGLRERVWAREKRRGKEPAEEREGLGPAVTHAGRGGGKGGPRERKGEGFWAGPAAGLSFLCFFFSFPLPNLFKQTI
jgi:hypothetical protein